MKIAEIFHSIQGEGSLVGTPAVFIRISGCNLRCSWCDTPYASWNPEGSSMTIGEIAAAARNTGAPYAVVTGGEPMIAPEIALLTRTLRDLGVHITIETAGTVLADVACDLMSISPKLSNSTPEGFFRAQHERLRLQPEILRELMGRYEYQLKFVIAHEPDIEEVREVIAHTGADPRRVLLMPEGVDGDTVRERGRMVAALCKQYGYRYSPRLHVDLWGNRRGV